MKKREKAEANRIRLGHRGKEKVFASLHHFLRKLHQTAEADLVFHMCGTSAEKGRKGEKENKKAERFAANRVIKREHLFGEREAVGIGRKKKGNPLKLGRRKGKR